MKKCLCGCGKVPAKSRFQLHKKDYYNFACYLRAIRTNKTEKGSYGMKQAITLEMIETQELLEWAKIGDRECMKILRDRHGLTMFSDRGTLFNMENARL